MKKLLSVTLSLLVLVILSANAQAGEKPIGIPQTENGMEIAAVYLQPIEMEPSKGPHAMRLRKDADIHIEADISAAEGNRHGFAAGEWVPYLKIGYTIIKLDTKEKIEGMMGAMVANDGPHYGDNVKMLGVGKYKVVLNIENPMANGFGRHTDKETGIAKWYKPFTVEYEFNYLGMGKKGGY